MPEIGWVIVILAGMLVAMVVLGVRVRRQG